VTIRHKKKERVKQKEEGYFFFCAFLTIFAVALAAFAVLKTLRPR
jgi:hypothetical protein